MAMSSLNSVPQPLHDGVMYDIATFITVIRNPGKFSPEVVANAESKLREQLRARNLDAALIDGVVREALAQ